MPLSHPKSYLDRLSAVFKDLNRRESFSDFALQKLIYKSAVTLDSSSDARVSALYLIIFAILNGGLKQVNDTAASDGVSDSAIHHKKWFNEFKHQEELRNLLEENSSDIKTFTDGFGQFAQLYSDTLHSLAKTERVTLRPQEEPANVSRRGKLYTAFFIVFKRLHEDFHNSIDKIIQEKKQPDLEYFNYRVLETINELLQRKAVFILSCPWNADARILTRLRRMNIFPPRAEESNFFIQLLPVFIGCLLAFCTLPQFGYESASTIPALSS